MDVVRSIQLVEVGPRDGLQSANVVLPVEVRKRLILKLVACGLKRIEMGSFVSEKRVPQMAGTKELAQQLMQVKTYENKDVLFSALVPNLRGLEEALEMGVQEVAFFTATSETFVKKNINCSIEESFIRLKQITKRLEGTETRLRGYLSTAFHCPYEGQVGIKRAISLVERLLDEGCDEVSIGDTTGHAIPLVIRPLLSRIDSSKVAMHFHNKSSPMSLLNIMVSIEEGVRIFDASIGGLGGCPFAKGAPRNVSTEELVDMLDQVGIETGVNSKELKEVKSWLSLRIQEHKKTHS